MYILYIDRGVTGLSALWGSDIPGSLNSAPYREMMDMFEKHSGLSEQSKNKLFYENVLKAYF